MSQVEGFPPPPDRGVPLSPAQRQELLAWALTYLRGTFPAAFDEERQRLAERMVAAIDWVQRKWGPNNPCPYCGNQTWEVGAPVELVTEAVTPQRIVARGERYPVTCTNCGNTVLVRVYQTGAL